MMNFKEDKWCDNCCRSLKVWAQCGKYVGRHKVWREKGWDETTSSKGWRKVHGDGAVPQFNKSTKLWQWKHSHSYSSTSPRAVEIRWAAMLPPHSQLRCAKTKWKGENKWKKKVKDCGQLFREQTRCQIVAVFFSVLFICFQPLKERLGNSPPCVKVSLKHNYSHDSKMLMNYDKMISFIYNFTKCPSSKYQKQIINPKQWNNLTVPDSLVQ